MWRKLFRPEVLFLLGTLQAFVPYATWYFNGPNSIYRYNVTYMPALIWAIGYLCFLLGCKSVAKPLRPRYPLVFLTVSEVKAVTIGVLILVVLETASTIQMYGSVPLYQFWQGTMDTLDVVTIQREQGFGQLGLLRVTLSLLDGLLLIVTIKSLEANRHPIVLTSVALLIGLFANALGGARQGTYMTIMFLACGLSLYTNNNPVTVLYWFVGAKTNKSLSWLTLATISFLLLSFTGFMVTMRTGGRVKDSGMDQITAYGEAALINFEAQCEQKELFRSNIDFLELGRALLPARVVIAANLQFNETPRKPEPTSPSGFYEVLHWSFGLVGASAGAFVFGMISRAFYNRALSSLMCLLIYCQISWALFAANFYNHFFNSMFLPLPAVLFVVLCTVIKHMKRQPYLGPTWTTSPRPTTGIT